MKNLEFTQDGWHRGGYQSLDAPCTLHDEIHTIGINRGNARVWLQAKWLIDAGFHNGAIYVVEYSEGKISITPSDKGRKVAGNIERPIIDLNSKKVTQALQGFDKVRVIAVCDRIEIKAQ
jgi:hypothetical protein